MSDAKAGHAEAGNTSKHGIVDTDANTDSGEEDEEENCSHASEDVRPAGSGLHAVIITVIFEFSPVLISMIILLFCINFSSIAVGTKAEMVIDDPVNFYANRFSVLFNDVVNVLFGVIIKISGDLFGSILGFEGFDLYDDYRAESPEVKSAENEGADSKDKGMNQNARLLFNALSGDYGLSFSYLDAEHHFHPIHLEAGFCVLNIIDLPMLVRFV